MNIKQDEVNTRMNCHRVQRRERRNA